MKQAFYGFCAVLLATAAYVAASGTASAASSMQIGQASSADTALQKVQYGGGGYDGDYGGGYGADDDEYTPPPPPRPRHHFRRDPGWSSDGKPRFRYQRFTRDFCYHCASYCDADGCPPKCWGWRKYCRMPRW